MRLMTRNNGRTQQSMAKGTHGYRDIKEAVEHYVTIAVRAERRVPGVYHWSPAASS